MASFSSYVQSVKLLQGAHTAKYSTVEIHTRIINGSLLTASFSDDLKDLRRKEKVSVFGTKKYRTWQSLHLEKYFGKYIY